MSWVAVSVAVANYSLDWIVPTLSVCLSARNLDKLQRIQNLAAHIVAYHQPIRHTSSYLFNLCWLPVEHRINFKIATLTYKTLATGQPGYLLNLLNTYQLVCSICSLAKYAVYIGRRAFSYAAAQIWNAISLNIRISPSVNSFKHNFNLLNGNPERYSVGFKLTESGNPGSSSGAISELPPACPALTRCPSRAFS